MVKIVLFPTYFKTQVRSQGKQVKEFSIQPKRSVQNNKGQYFSHFQMRGYQLLISYQ
jgi:hypothetical protein